jgi:hypothetical protein
MTAAQITKEEFIEFYETRMPNTMRGVRKRNWVPMPCNCGEAGCQGWAMVQNDIDTIYRINILPNLWRWRHAYLSL